MNINIISIGKFNNSLFKDSFLDYAKRLNWKIELKEIENKKSSNLSSQQNKIIEQELIFKNLRSDSYKIALDERGQQFSSIEFAKFMQDKILKSFKNIDFIIGGADGLGDKVLEMVGKKISFGKMTFPHMMVRVLLIEQLYRSQTIIDGHPYHRQ